MSERAIKEKYRTLVKSLQHVARDTIVEREAK